MQPVRSLYVYVNFVNVQASSKEVHLNLWGLVIFLTEKQMNFAAGCIFVSSTENCTNLWCVCVIAFQGCVIISATILKCASLAVHLVFVLRTFEERLVCCYSSMPCSAGRLNSWLICRERKTLLIGWFVKEKHC